MHTDQNHSWLPAVGRPPWWNLEGFLYMTDVTESANPTRMVSLRDTENTPSRYPVLMPDFAPDVYAAEQAAVQVRGSYLAYRSDVFHRGAAFAEEGTGRTVLALAFRNAAHEWIGYDEARSRSNSPEWTHFVEYSSPPRVGAVRVPATWPRDLGRATTPSDPVALSEARSRTVEEGTRSLIGPWIRPMRTPTVV